MKDEGRGAYGPHAPFGPWAQAPQSQFSPFSTRNLERGEGLSSVCGRVSVPCKGWLKVAGSSPVRSSNFFKWGVLLSGGYFSPVSLQITDENWQVQTLCIPSSTLVERLRRHTQDVVFERFRGFESHRCYFFIAKTTIINIQKSKPK